MWVELHIIYNEGLAMLNPKRGTLTIEEYLKGETFSDIKHEYIDGEAYAMVGATQAHNIISFNIAREIGNFLKGQPCQTYISDMKVRVKNNFFYPDVMVDCSKGTDNKSLFKENPILIIEVLSDSTSKTDRTTKFSSYKNITSLEEYVLIDQDYISVQIFRRKSSWRGQVYLMGEKVDFESIGLTLPIEELYEGVNIEFDI